MGSNVNETRVTDNSDLDFQDVLEVIRNSWLPGFIGFLTFGVLGLAISFLIRPDYRTEVLLEYVGDPTKQERARSGASGLGGLAALAGVSLGSDGNPKDAALAILRSWDFAGQFIRDNNLMPILNAEDWDKSGSQWLESSKPPSEWRTIRRFRRDVLYVGDDAKTGLVSIVVTWEDPAVAADWAKIIVSTVNARLKASTIKETTRSIEHLKTKMAETQNSELQRAIAGLLQAQIEALMFADIRDEFAFRTIDPARPPPKDEYVYPNHFLFLIVGGLAGGLAIAVFWLVRRTRKYNRRRVT